MMNTVHVVLDFEMNPVSREIKEQNREKKYSRHGRNLQSEIIEIGAVKLEDPGCVKTDEFSILVKPEYNDSIEPKIQKLTGICTEDVQDAVGYSEAMREFSDWIGSKEHARIYSWSNSDSNQIRCECEFKDVEFPENMSDWVDFQVMFPRETGLQIKRQMSLEYAAELGGIDFDDESAHRALYDAQKTAELVHMVLTGEYKDKMKNVTGVLRSDVEIGTATMADKLGSKYAELMERFGSSEV
ncbi:MAG: exonuclease domain-containing protein [Eubacteriales bacterium]|jgi:DNA polymerase III epsilon subunit-like protein|nr:exonuclease domain-containing protein [Eubacteriales bacterium]